MNPAEDVDGTTKKFPVSESLEVVLKYKNFNYFWPVFLACYTWALESTNLYHLNAQNLSVDYPFLFYLVFCEQPHSQSVS